MNRDDNSKKTFSIFFRKALNFLFALGIVFGVIFIFARVGLWFEKGAKKIDDSKRISSVGEVVETGSMKGTYAIVEYVVNGKKYKRKDGCPSGTEVGQKFVIEYDKGNPFFWNIFFEKPLFLKDELTEKTKGKVCYKDWAVF